MTYLKPDGIIETRISGCCCPPGERRKGQHTNAGTSWFRINKDPWIRDDCHDARRLAPSALTVRDFQQLWENDNKPI